MVLQSNSKDVLYAAVERVLANATSDAEIRDALARLAWSDAKFDEGRALLGACLTLEQKTASALGTQVGMTSALNEAVRNANAAYMDLVVVCRDEIEAPDVRQALRLDAPRAKYSSLDAWRRQADAFLSAALDDPDVWPVVDDVGLTVEQLEAVRDQVRAVADTDHRQEQSKSDAQTVSESLQNRRTELRRWLGRFSRRARRALRTQPQKLEALGIAAETALEG